PPLPPPPPRETRHDRLGANQRPARRQPSRPPHPARHLLHRKLVHLARPANPRPDPRPLEKPRRRRLSTPATTHSGRTRRCPRRRAFNRATIFHAPKATRHFQRTNAESRGLKCYR